MVPLECQERGQVLASQVNKEILAHLVEVLAHLLLLATNKEISERPELLVVHLVMNKATLAEQQHSVVLLEIHKKISAG